MEPVQSPSSASSEASGRPTWAEIDLAALAENFSTLRSLLTIEPQARDRASTKHRATTGDCRVSIPPRIIPVIKADAYGHGAIQVAKALAGAGATAFAVALVEEGVQLRQAGIAEEIVVLQGAWPGQESESIVHGLTTAVHSPEGIRRLDRAARALARVAPVHLKLDTGMARLGVSWEAMRTVVEPLLAAKHIRLQGTFSHLACSEEEDSTYTLEQIRRFEHALVSLRNAGLDPGEVHLANSAGLLYFNCLRGLSARPGIALYGYPPAPHRSPVKLKEVLTLKTRIGRLHTIEPGSTIGYNQRFKASRVTRAATLPIGYADGYRHRLTGRGRVIIRDQWSEVLGSVAMDMIVVDVTEIPGAAEGDEVMLLGSSPRCQVTALDWAEVLGTISYEVLCSISPRVPRIYKSRPEVQGPKPENSRTDS